MGNHGCSECGNPWLACHCAQPSDAQATVEVLQRERDQWKEAFERSCDDTAHLRTALDAEREKVRRRTEECNEISRLYVDSQTQLTQLQALVRALPVVETELSDKHRAIHISASISINSEVHGLVDPLKALLDYRRTLDATTPAPIDAAETHDRMFNHMDRHPEAL